MSVGLGLDLVALGLDLKLGDLGERHCLGMRSLGKLLEQLRGLELLE